MSTSMWLSISTRPTGWFSFPQLGSDHSSLVSVVSYVTHRLGGYWAATHALWWLEEGSKSQGGHFVQGGVAFQVALSIIIISSPAFESSSSSPLIYSSPRLVEDWMEELIVGLLLVENAWCQKQSWSFMHLLCSGMVGFGLRRKLGTAGTERDSPLVLPPWPGGILILLAGFVLFSTVVFLGDLEIYFFVPVSRQ